MIIKLITIIIIII